MDMRKTLFLTAFLMIFGLSEAIYAQKKPIEINKQDFISKVINYEDLNGSWQYLGDKPAIVEFYADWCPPCKVMASVLKDLAKEYAGKMDVYKINVDKQKELSKEIGIASIPTIFICPVGKQPLVVSGAVSKETLQMYIEEELFGNISE